MKSGSYLVCLLSFLLVFSFLSFVDADDQGNISVNSQISVGSSSQFNESNIEVLSPVQKTIWISILAVLFLLVVAIIVIGIRLTSSSPEKDISNEIKSAEKEISRKYVERAKKL
jgi:ABC-type Fe3+ transport system permease subunit